MRIRRACLALVLVCLLAMALPAPMHAYDANGNMTAWGTRTIEWDAENRPVSVKEGGNAVASFVYDGFGDRVMKTAGGQTTIYVNDYYAKVLGGAETLHYYLGGLYIGYKKGGTLKYVHTDHLGSTSLVTNTSGATVSEIRYYPFGKTRSVTPAGSLDTDIRFTGQRYDSETGLYYYRARYYDPDLGRFLSPDSIVQDPANPQAWNPYTYVLNNPLKYTDPSGNLVWFAPILIGMAIGASSSAAIYGGQVLFTDWDWDWRGFAVETGVGAALGGLGGVASAMKAARGAKTLTDVGDDFAKGIIARPQSASLSIREARAYYNAKLPTLEKVVFRMESQGASREAIARQTSHLRNVLKERTRGLMANRTFAQLLERYRPLKPIEHYIEKYSAEGLKGDALWNRIIEKSLTPNQGVNFFLGM